MVKMGAKIHGIYLVFFGAHLFFNYSRKDVGMRQNKSVYLHFRLTQSECEAVKRQADKRDQNTSELLRDLIKQALDAESRANQSPVTLTAEPQR